MSYQVAALVAAFSYALAGLIAAGPSRELGGPRFTRLRMLIVSVLLLGIALAVGGWNTIPTDDLSLLLLFGSAVFGLVVGDAALFTGFARFGPRRTAIVFTTNAPMSAVLGALLYDEAWTRTGVIGTTLIIGGVLLAVFFGTRPGQTHRFEQIVGNPVVAFAWALLGALGQALGAVMIEPVFDDGAATWPIAAARALIATPLLWAFARPIDAAARPAQREPLNARYWMVLIASAVIAMVVGTTLLLFAINNGPVGEATILASTTPIMMLPLLWIATKERPGIGSWAGALVAFVGTVMLVSS